MWNWLSALRRISLPRMLMPAAPDASRSVKMPKKQRIPAWQYAGMLCLARTKSEARAKFKRDLGLKRLPVGAVVSLV